MTNLQIAQLAARNAEAAYLFHSVEHDRDAAEFWWKRLCHWQRQVEALQSLTGIAAGEFDKPSERQQCVDALRNEIG